jgi:hypothetical protein
VTYVITGRRLVIGLLLGALAGAVVGVLQKDYAWSPWTTFFATTTATLVVGTLCFHVDWARLGRRWKRPQGPMRT